MEEEERRELADLVARAEAAIPELRDLLDRLENDWPGRDAIDMLAAAVQQWPGRDGVDTLAQAVARWPGMDGAIMLDNATKRYRD